MRVRREAEDRGRLKAKKCRHKESETKRCHFLFGAWPTLFLLVIDKTDSVDRVPSKGNEVGYLTHDDSASSSLICQFRLGAAQRTVKLDEVSKKLCNSFCSGRLSSLPDWESRTRPHSRKDFNLLWPLAVDFSMPTRERLEDASELSLFWVRKSKLVSTYPRLLWKE